MCRITQRKQAQFLRAYQEDPTIAAAARQAGVHRSTVYRWCADPAFVAAMEVAADRWHQAHLERYALVEAERRRRREVRNAELRPMRQALAAAARAKKRR